MQIVNYKKLLTKVRSGDVFRWTAISIGIWELFIIIIDHFVNFTLLNFKLLLAPCFIFFIVGAWIASNLHDEFMNRGT